MSDADIILYATPSSATIEAEASQMERLPRYGGDYTVTPSDRNIILPIKDMVAAHDITVIGDEDLISENIRDGINLFGVDGSLTPNTGYYEGSMDITPKTTSQILPTNGKVVNGDIKVRAYSPGNIIVTSKTVTPSSDSLSIAFTGINYPPKVFYVQPVTAIAISTTRYILVASHYTSTTVNSISAYKPSSTSTSPTTAVYATTKYTYNANAKTLTVTSPNATTVGYFKGTVQYRLVYAYLNA